MGDSELPVQYGIPVLYQPSHFDSFVSSFAGPSVSHVTDGVVFQAVRETVPLGSGLATPVSKCKSTATLSSCAESSHVVLMCSDLDSESTVRQTAAQLLPGTRLTVLSLCEHKVQVVKGEVSLQHHGDFLLAAPILDQLGLPTASGSSPPLSSSSSLPLFMFSVHSCLLTVR